jgi:uncharacterized membrane protein (DUF4010 family)
VVAAAILAAAADAAEAADFASLLRRAAVATLLGLLLGVERQRSATETERLFAGVRTFPLLALLGFLASLLADATGSTAVFVAVTAVVGGLVVAAYVLTSLGDDKGATTEIAGLLAYFLGAACFRDPLLPFATAVAVGATALLSLREEIHGFVSRVSREDVYAALKLAVITLVVLPLLPDRWYGPHEAVNPHRLWKYTVLIAGISFAGYVAVKVVGAAKGIAVTGILGGLTSSTAVTLAFSRRSREEPRLVRPFAGAIVLASTIMFPRTLLYAAAACPPLLALLWKPVALLTAVGAAAGLLLHFRRGAGEEGERPVEFRNPFELGSALKFGILLAAIGFASRASRALFGDAGFQAVAVLVGLADVDGFAVAAAGDAQRMLDGSDPAAEAFLGAVAGATILAMFSNTVVKGALACTLGSPELRRAVVPAFGAMAAAAAAAALVLV